MSAFLVSEDHIKLLATWANSLGGLDLDAVNKTAEVLWRANVQSVNARYHETRGTEDVPTVGLYEFSAAKRVDPVAVLKQVQCYEYQACEFRGWDTSEAKEICDTITRRAIEALPGYDAAPWGM